MRRLLLVSTFALTSMVTPALAWDTTTITTPPTQVQHQTAQGGAGGVGGAGGAGGSAASSAASRSISGARSGSVANGSVSVNAGNSGGWNQAPDVSIPSIGGGGSDCPVVGFGVGGSGLGGGGGFGPSWISADCNTRKLAELLSRLGRRDAALAVLEEHFPEVKRAMTVSAPPSPPPHTRPDWCLTASAAERFTHKECR
jgi:hypothetical protein